MWIAGFLVAVQIFAGAFAIVNRHPPFLFSSPIPSETGPGYPSPPDTAPRPGATTDYASDDLTPPRVELVNVSPEPQTGTALVPKTTSPAPLAPDLSPITDPAGEIQDPLLARLVENGVASRRRGNLGGALEAFLEAANNSPNHPRILAEIAGTHGQLGNAKVAAEYWNKLASLGPLAAGEFFDVAKRALSGEAPVPATLSRNLLRLGAIRVEQQPPARDGQWVHVFVPITSGTPIQLNSNDMDLRVQIYDQLSDGRIAPTTANVVYEFLPRDWRSKGIKEIEMIYHQRHTSSGTGDRNFFGYVIELYYQNQLQDSVVSTDQLRGLRFQSPKPVEKSQVVPDGPDGSLFPINPAR